MKSTNSISLRQLRCFVTVAEELHFRRAAERLNISQPPLTQRIQAMERDLGVQLFTRKGHLIKLTEAGRLVVTEAQAVLAQVDRVQEVARQAGQGEAGNLRLAGVISTSLIPTFSQATTAFKRDCPGVVLDLVQTTARNAFEAFRQHDVDMCVIRRGVPELPGVAEIVLARDRLMLALPSGHPKALADKVTLGDVAEEQFILWSRDSMALYRQTMDVWARTGLTPRTAQRADNGLAMLALIAAGVGNAIIGSTLRGIHMPSVMWKEIDMDEQWTSSSIVLLYRTDGRNEKVQSRFIDYIRQHSSGVTNNSRSA
jgi:DNA-binding transcriptional LysR family regulator